MLNDTFDDFNFTNFANSVSQPKNGVSFDDSLFLDSQELSILQNSDQETKKIDDYFSSPLVPTLQNEKYNSSMDSDIFGCDSPKSGLFDSPRDLNPANDTQSQSSLFDSPRDLKPTNDDSPLAEPSPLQTRDLEPTNDNQALASWGLPAAILDKYTSRKITRMFPWQVECLNNPKVLKMNKNLVYSAPTSAGKTLVAEILSIKTVLERSKKVIFILPFVSVVREKMFYFQDIFGGSGVRVEGFMGSYNPPGGFKSVQFAVCTIEKANSLINTFLQDGSLGEIGAVVIDEMHLLGESHRGYILELLLTKLKYMTLKDETIEIQIIGMSATLPNLKTLADWLDAELYVTDFRPIPLHEQVLLGDTLYDTKFSLVRRLEPLPHPDTDHILQLCLETITANCSVLIFCPTKNWCENLATQIAQAFYTLGRGDTNHALHKQLNAEAIAELLTQLSLSPIGLDDVLRKTVSFGVAFHHAGLTMDERDIIEGGFRGGVIRVLVATSTLSSGVNLPARRVIIRTPMFHGRPIDGLSYRQMVGRAGRMGKDTSGESILVCQKSDEKFVRKLFEEELDPIVSCLEQDGRLRRAILEIVASGVATTPDDVHLFAKCTLLGHTSVEEALDFLTTNEFLRLGDQKYTPSGLGKACLTSSIPPEDGLALFAELDKARQCFVLDTELHLVYLVTPYSACHQWGHLDWMNYLQIWEKLPSSMRKVGELVGVRESYIVAGTRGNPQTSTSQLYQKLQVHKRFYIALALQDLVNERPLSAVCAKFGCNRGLLQMLQLTAATFAGMVTSFSRQLGWSNVEILISQFQDRLHFGVSRDLLDLMRLPLLNGRSARALYNSGLETLIQIANSDVDTIESIFLKVVPFESTKLREGETEHALRRRNKFRNIWITGKEGLTEGQAAELILRSAREFLRIEMGLKEAKWGPIKSEISLNSTGDFIVASQDESVSFKTPKKRGRRRGSGETPVKKPRMSFDLETVDVCSHDRLFGSFTQEVKSATIVSLALVSCVKTRRVIGLSDTGVTIEGFALFWGGSTTYYLDMNKKRETIDVIRHIVNDKQKTIIMCDCKEQIKVLQKWCGVEFGSRVEDPKVADWLLEPEGREKNLQELVQVYCPDLGPMLVKPVLEPKLRSIFECYLSWQIVKSVKTQLSEINLLTVFDLEMSILRILANMELAGIGVNKPALSNLVDLLTREQKTIERQGHALAGRHFSFASSKQLSKILQSDTGKKSLQKNANPLADLILKWRKISAATSKTLQPLIRLVENGRIFGCYVTHTATGRISMHEPNLQNVAKNFDISGIEVSCRQAFVPNDGHVMVSADFCQLELRILAHLSRDEVLCQILRREGDIFRAVAAKWNGMSEIEVTEELRQRAKQICYGIIYGMGSKALAEQLSIEESQATRFMQSFRNAYPGVQKYVTEVVETCRKKGFVETLAGRRRFLPHINHKNGAVRSQAERQAVNTTIQGSAADIVKRTMIRLETVFLGEKQVKLVLHLHDELLYEVPEASLGNFVRILKKEMEESVKLSIPFPVKVKTGPNWGQLTEYKL